MVPSKLAIIDLHSFRQGLLFRIVQQSERPLNALQIRNVMNFFEANVCLSLNFKIGALNLTEDVTVLCIPSSDK